MDGLALVRSSCYRGMCELSCHGGVADFASPIFYLEDNLSDFIVVITGVFKENEELVG